MSTKEFVMNGRLVPKKMSLRIAHASDVHLDVNATACQGRIVRDAEGINIRWRDRVRCFEAFVEGAIKSMAEVCIVAGDLFDKTKPTPNEYELANRVLDRASESMLTFVIGDNHGNPESSIEVHAVEPIKGRGKNLIVESRACLHRLETPSGTPVQIAALPSPRRSIVAAKEEYQGKTPEEINWLVSERLRLVIQRLLADCDPSMTKILVAHVMVQGCFTSAKGGEPSAGGIILSPKDFAGWDYVALGDVHLRQQFGERIYYSGSLDRIGFGEEHDAKSWNLVDLEYAGNPMQCVGLEVNTVASPARSYRTYQPEELTHRKLIELRSLPSLDEWPVVRAKGEISHEEYLDLAPTLREWKKLPLFSDELAVIRTARSRNADITDDLSPEKALRTWAVQHERLDTEALVAEHTMLEREVLSGKR